MAGNRKIHLIVEQIIAVIQDELSAQNSGGCLRRRPFPALLTDLTKTNLTASEGDTGSLLNTDDAMWCPINLYKLQFSRQRALRRSLSLAMIRPAMRHAR